MTAPVFSDTEITAIRATRKVCPSCMGQCRLRHRAPTKLYPCGFYTYVAPCSECAGLGTVEATPAPVRDFKNEACND